MNDAFYNGQRLLWFVGEQLHCDGHVFADYRGLPDELKEDEITARVHKLLGKIEVHFEVQKEMPLE